MRRVTAVLAILRRVEGEPDRYGNPTVGWEQVSWPVFAVAPRIESSDPGLENRDPVVRGLTVFAPANGPRPAATDRVLVDGDAFDVVGDVGVWDRNPHVLSTRHRGIVVNLKRTEG